jgi:N-acetylneuraminic acid mutarotase
MFPGFPMKDPVSISVFLMLVCPVMLLADQPQAGPVLSWSELPSLPDPLGVAGPFAGVHNDALIVAGGANFPRPVWENEKAWYSDIHVLVKRGDRFRWKRGGTLPRPIAYGAAVSTPDGVVCMGGNDGTQTFSEVHLLQWNAGARRIRIQPYPALPQPCAFGQAVVVDGVIYLAGGQQGQGLETAMTNFWSLDLARREDPAAFTWKVLKPWPGPSRALNLTVRQDNGDHDCIYVISGRRQQGDEVQFLRDSWEFTPDTGSWRQRADAPRSVMAGIGMGDNRGNILVLGGADGSMFYRVDELKDRHPGFPLEALSYHPATDSWSSAGKMPANHVTTVAVRWDGQIIIPSGEIRPRVRSAKIWRVRTVAQE